MEANQRTLTASGDSRDELRQRFRRDSPDQPHREAVPHRLEPEPGLVCREVPRRLEKRTIHR
ncbi:MAG: hypothetical protein Q8L00_07780 [Deltaproteobacteria bacterium]|nr:hypothetical protein [Deltaproteobacteria bacterium]